MRTTIHVNMDASTVTVSEIKFLLDGLKEALREHPGSEVVITVDPMKKSRRRKH